MEPDAVFAALIGLTRNPEKKRLIDVKMTANYFTKAIFHAAICGDQRFVCGPALNAFALARMATFANRYLAIVTQAKRRDDQGRNARLGSYSLQMFEMSS
jgi:hypothetical protein